MQVTKLIMDHVRNIEHSEYSFRPGLNVIIGDNGTGKTAILESLAIALGGFIAGVPDVATRSFHADDFTRISVDIGDGSSLSQIPFEITVTVSVELNTGENNKDFTWKRYKRKVSDSKTSTTPHQIDKEALELYNDPNKNLPIILYQSASRPWNQAKNKKNDVFHEKYTRSVGYSDCLQNTSNIKFITDWFKRMDYISLKKNKPIREFESAKMAISEFLYKMTGVKGTVVYDGNELTYGDGKNNLPIHLLSSGYQSLTGLVLEIACRMSMLNPNLLEKAYKKTPGVVLIDEIDLHLHPKWQWMVLQTLQEVFPNVQFIVSTHSPIIISSTENINIIDLNQKTDDLATNRSFNGWQINDVLRTVMGSPERNPEFTEMIAEFMEITKKKFHKTASEEELKKYDNIESILLNSLPEEDATLEIAKMNAIADEIRNGKSNA